MIALLTKFPILLYLIPLLKIIGAVILFVLLVLALKKYLVTKETRTEKQITAKTLGEVLKSHRMECKMTQEFVAEAVGVSRQAVSKWESGSSDPSTSNLLALAKLYGISAEELLTEIKTPKKDSDTSKSNA